MFNTIGICKILHMVYFAVYNMWRNDGNFQRIFFTHALHRRNLQDCEKYNTRRGRELIIWIINQFSFMLISLKTCVLFVWKSPWPPATHECSQKNSTKSVQPFGWLHATKCLVLFYRLLATPMLDKTCVQLNAVLLQTIKPGPLIRGLFSSEGSKQLIKLKCIYQVQFKLHMIKLKYLIGNKI